MDMADAMAVDCVRIPIKTVREAGIWRVVLANNMATAVVVLKASKRSVSQT